MRQENTDELIIEIDDQISVLIEEINASPDGAGLDFAEACRDVIVDSLMGPFGLSRSMFVDKQGGNVTTVHNFEQGYVATEADARRYDNYVRARERPANLETYRRGMAAERKATFKRDSPIFDAYTGKELLKDGRAHIDHVVSIRSIETSAKGHLAQTRSEREATANLPENKVWTDASLNLSKNESPLETWMDAPYTPDPTKTNVEGRGIDPDQARRVERRARAAVNRVQNVAVLKKQSRELLHVGARDAGRLAIRQVLGLFLKDLAEGLIDDVRTLVRTGVQGVEHLVSMLKNRISETIEAIKSKWQEYIKAGVDAGISGFLYNLVTLLVNSLWTTAKNIVRVIREGTMSVVRAVRIIVSPPPHMSKAEVALEVFKILSGALVIAVGIGLEEVIKKGIETIAPLAPFAGTIAPVITGIITGIASLLVVLAFDKLKNHIKFQNKQLADLHRGQSVTLLEMKKTVLVVDEAMQFVQVSSEYLRQEIAIGRAEMEDVGRATDARIDGYSKAVARLKDLSEAF